MFRKLPLIAESPALRLKAEQGLCWYGVHSCAGPGIVPVRGLSTYWYDAYGCIGSSVVLVRGLDPCWSAYRTTPSTNPVLAQAVLVPGSYWSRYRTSTESSVLVFSKPVPVRPRAGTTPTAILGRMLYGPQLLLALVRSSSSLLVRSFTRISPLDLLLFKTGDVCNYILYKLLLIDKVNEVY
jgi:hypothetical protein